MDSKGIVIQEPVIIEEAEKILKAFYEYKSKEGIGDMAAAVGRHTECQERGG